MNTDKERDNFRGMKVNKHIEVSKDDNHYCRRHDVWYEKICYECSEHKELTKLSERVAEIMDRYDLSLPLEHTQFKIEIDNLVKPPNQETKNAEFFLKKHIEEREYTFGSFHYQKQNILSAIEEYADQFRQYLNTIKH